MLHAPAGLRLHPLSIPVLLALVAAPAGADVVTLPAARDNTLYESTDGSVSNGAGAHLFAGLTDQGKIRRGLIAFDVGAAIPPGSTVNSVTLTLNMSRTKAKAHPVGLHLVLSDWGEGASDADGQEGEGGPSASGDATWLHSFYPSSLWSSTGGDFAATASATTTVDGQGAYSWSSAGLVSDVQAWVNDPGLNHGWLLICNEGHTDKTAKRFDSRENTDVTVRPELVVDFTTTTPVGACCLPDGTCTSVSGTDCANLGGTYQGDGTTCFPDPCVVATGACCFEDGSCSNLTQADCLAQGGTYKGDGSDCATTDCPVVLTPFVDELPLPAVAQPIVGAPGDVAEYEIRMQQVQQKLHKNLPPTTVWTYDGSTPGPIIEAFSDKPVEVRWINDLRDDQGNFLTEHPLDVDLCPHGAENAPKTVVHLHGGHVPPEADGYPEDTFLPGEDALYAYPNDQLPGTLWFHDHALGITRLNVYMGLAGAYIVRDQLELDLGLPDAPYEVPLVIQDRSFDENGQLSYPSVWQDQFFGDVMLVNGMVWPYFEVKKGKYRFRLLNGCNSRTLTLSLSTGTTFHVIGTEGGLLPAPVPVTEVTITPGERMDVVMDFEGFGSNDEILLENSAPAPFPGTPGVGVLPDVMKFIVKGGQAFTDPLPETLRPLDVLQESDAVEHREFVLRKGPDPCSGTAWLINGLHWDDITEYPKLGTTEVWSFINDSGMVHPMHMHLVFFQVLDRQDFVLQDGQVVPVGPKIPPSLEEAGWKDTVQTLPDQITRVIARFTGWTGKYPYHCHILEHEDHEMMRQFQVIPGPDTTPYGCGVNPDGSLVVVSGTPSIGTTLTLGVDNPLGTQAPGSVPVLAISNGPDPAFPCGSSFPGWGMTAPGFVGELLISLLPPNPLAALIGPVWTGQGNPAPIALPIPGNPGLIGATVYVQGALVDPIGAQGPGIGLTTGFVLDIGP